MNKALKSIGSVVVALAALVGSAQAIPSEALELGLVQPGSPSDGGSEVDRLVFLVNSYNAGLTGVVANPGDLTHTYTLIPDASMPAAPSLPSVGTYNGQTGGSPATTGLVIDLGLGGYGYALVKWGNDSEYYYIGTLTGEVVFNNHVNRNGESHHVLFGGGTTVPDGGMTLVLLGSSLTGLAFFARSRKISRSK